jgi:hypothetical protein
MNKNLLNLKSMLTAIIMFVGLNVWAQPGTSVTEAIEINTFPHTESIDTKANGVYINNQLGGTTCNNLPCCPALVYKVTLHEYGSLRVENLNFANLSGGIIVYTSTVDNPTGWGDLQYWNHIGNICGYKKSMSIGRYCDWGDGSGDPVWLDNIGGTPIDYTNATHVVPPGDYYVIIMNYNKQSNTGGTATDFLFQFKAYSVADPLTGTVNVSGTPKFGEELTATVTGSNNTGTLSYQWKRGDADISGATTNKYTLTEDDITKSISVDVTSSVESGKISSTGTANVEKADQMTPAKPTLASKTHNKITLNAVSGCEYAVNGGTWQSSVQFTGLNAKTEYNLTQRYAETNTHKASDASPALTVETNAAPLTGSVNINGTLKFGETLTATVTGSNNSGTLNYQWQRDNSDISGANAKTYTLVKEDITKSISVIVTSSVETGNIPSEGTSDVAKADQMAPAKPTLASKTDKTINLNVVSGCEYAIDGGAWQSSAEFTGLTKETEYSLTQRYAETDTHIASAVSATLTVETAAEVLTGTVAISGTLKYGEELTATVTGSNNSGTISYQWKRGGTDISSATTNKYTLTEDDITKSISVNVTSSVESGKISSTATANIEKADQMAPAKPTMTGKTHNTITLNVVSGCEYAIDGGTWQSSAEFSGLTSGTEYSITQRLAETNTHKASIASSALTVETSAAPLKGTIAITGILKYGEELTANVNSAQITGTLSYQWKRDGSDINGATAKTYTLTEEDIEKSISVDITSSVETGTLTSPNTVKIQKADKKAPAKPTLTSKTENSITLNVVSGCEYAINGGTWQTSAEFTELTKATKYSLTQRYIETNTHSVSEASPVLEVTTNATTSVDNNSIAGNLIVYPNPATDKLTISNIKVGSQLMIFNAAGNKVLQQEATATKITLNVSNLKSGVYFIKADNYKATVVIK